MSNIKTHSILLAEYAYGPTFPNAMVYSGYHDISGTSPVAYFIGVLQGPNGIILVDCGYDSSRPLAAAESRKQGHIRYLHPTKVLDRLGIHPEDVSHVILTHLHWDHAGCIQAFPRAKFYLQKDELLQWIATYALPPQYNALKASVAMEDIMECMNLLSENRLVLLEGDCDELFPGISIRVARNGHSWASNLIIVNTENGEYIFTGDIAYTKRNLLGACNNGILLPNGYNCGSVFNIIQAMNDILTMVNGDITHVLISHDADIWSNFKCKTYPDGLRIAYVSR